MKENYPQRIEKARRRLAKAKYVVIGGGSGLSAAAGLTYAGARFTKNFPDFIRRYGMTDMYSAGFYPFPSQEEKWAYWSRHILLNRFLPGALPLYEDLLCLVRDKEYFVVTTNVDAAFEKAGFDQERLFAVQGDYGKIQCAKGCHDTLYDGECLMRKMAEEQKNCCIPAALVPKCPVCGGDMEVHIRKDAFFAEDEEWRRAADRYAAFLARAKGEKTVLLELGVGFNTPSIIRFPFERMTEERESFTLIRINRDFAESPERAEKRSICFSEDMRKVIAGLSPD